MTKVNIRNFQSIKKADFEVKGFTVIIGKNNIGKSAVVRSIHAALTNQTGTDFIRHGEKSTEVTLEKEDLKIEWKKGSTASYKVNGTPYTKLNRAVPQPILDAGFKKLDIGDQKISPLFALQFDEIFLLDKTGSVVTEVLSAMYNLDIISKADDLCQKQNRANKSLLKTRKKDQETLEEQLIAFKDLDQIKEGVKGYKGLELKCKGLKENIDELKSFESTLYQIASSLKNLNEVLNVSVPNSLETDKLESVSNQIVDLSGMETKLSDTVQAHKVLRPVTGVVIPKNPSIDNILEDTEALSGWCLRLEQSNRAVKQFEDFKEIDAGWMVENVEDLKNNVEDLKLLQGSETEFRSLVTTAQSSRNELKTISDKLEEFKKEKKKLETSLKVCPLCEKPYD